MVDEIDSILIGLIQVDSESFKWIQIWFKLIVMVSLMVSEGEG